MKNEDKRPEGITLGDYIKMHAPAAFELCMESLKRGDRLVVFDRILAFDVNQRLAPLRWEAVNVCGQRQFQNPDVHEIRPKLDEADTKPTS